MAYFLVVQVIIIIILMPDTFFIVAIKDTIQNFPPLCHFFYKNFIKFKD